MGPQSVELQRTGRDRRALVLLVVAGIAIALAVAKPWDEPPVRTARATDPAPASGRASVPTRIAAVAADGTPTPSPVPSAAPTAAPSVAPTLGVDTPQPGAPSAPVALDRPACATGTGWRLITLTRSGSVRSRSIQPAPLTKATSAIARSIAVVPVAADELDGIGFCVPRRDEAYAVAYPVRTAVWRVPLGGPPERIDGLTTLSFAFDATAERLYAPPRFDGPDIPSWPPASYAISVSNGDGTIWWLGVEFRSTLPTVAAE